jgi:DNA repair exonuclease SbcCD ATPase subunit
MFGLIKKKKEYDLADQIPVDNLKKYVVQGYEKEKALELQIEQKDSEIEKLQNDLQQFEALKVVLENQEKTIVDLNGKLSSIDRYKSRVEDLESKNNTLRIEKKQLADEVYELKRQEKKIAERVSDKVSKETTAAIKLNLKKKILGIKGNLSKGQVVNLIDQVQQDEQEG